MLYCSLGPRDLHSERLKGARREWERELSKADDDSVRQISEERKKSEKDLNEERKMSLDGERLSGRE